MQSCCTGSIISGFIKAVLIAGFSALFGYLVIGIGSPFYIFLISFITITLLAVAGGLCDLAVGAVLGIFANWIIFGLDLLPTGFEDLILENFRALSLDPPASLDLFIAVCIVLIIFAIEVIPVSLFKPGPDDGNVLFGAGLVVGIVTGVIFYFVFGDQPDLQLVTSMTIYGAIVGFIGGLIPGSPC